MDRFDVFDPLIDFFFGFVEMLGGWVVFDDFIEVEFVVVGADNCHPGTVGVVQEHHKTNRYQQAHPADAPAGLAFWVFFYCLVEAKRCRLVPHFFDKEFGFAKFLLRAKIKDQQIIQG
jgi:hypothetical protein